LPVGPTSAPPATSYRTSQEKQNKKQWKHRHEMMH